MVFSEEMKTRTPSTTTVCNYRDDDDLETAVTTTTTTSSMQFTNNNQMNELPEGSRLFLVTPKDCTDDVLNKAVLSVLKNEEFKLEPEDLVKMKILGIASGEDKRKKSKAKKYKTNRKMARIPLHWNMLALVKATKASRSLNSRQNLRPRSLQSLFTSSYTTSSEI